MMQLLVPLGLLGLLGIAVLIIIYILKPNYQQKVVSSTHVWKLSLKYRRKRIPINRLLSLLILICQILIVTACAFILAQPALVTGEAESSNERVIVIDSSANMLVASDGATRYERAVEQARELTASTLAQSDGIVTVILATDEPEYLFRRLGNDRYAEALAELDALVADGVLQCGYNQADVEAAMELAEDVLDSNSYAQVIFYTGTTYLDDSGVTVVNVAQEGEWNAAILDAEVDLFENFYTFTVEVASYGRNATISVHCDIYGANSGNIDVSLVYPNIQCTMGEPVTIEIATGENKDPVNCETPVYAYDRTRIYVEVVDGSGSDSFSYDDSITLYGGRPETIKVQYASSAINPFVSRALSALRTTMDLRWTIDIDEVDLANSDNEAQVEGYDLYVFENTMPDIMPTDGVVILLNPQSAPTGSGLTLQSIVEAGGEPFTLTAGTTHSVTQGIDPENISVSRYVRISLYDGYEPLLYVNGDPALLLKNDPYEKIAVLSFSVNYSLPIGFDYPSLLYNMFAYFMPSTVTKVTEQNGVTQEEVGFMFEIGETVTLNARGPVLSLTGPNGEAEYDVFPSTMVATAPGVYTLTQTLLSGETMTDSFYVKVAASESDTARIEDKIEGIVFTEGSQDNIQDLLLYFAIALSALLFIEWLLQIKENF